MRKLVEELFDQPRPNTRHGVWTLTAENRDGRTVFAARRDHVDICLEDARISGLRSEGVDALRLVGLYIARDTGYTWRLVQTLNARGERPE